MATKPAVRTQTEEPAAPAQKRPVRLLRLGSFNEPTYLTAPRGDRRRFVVERAGTIRIVRGGRVLGRPFLDISDRVTTGGESGLLSMAFARDYSSSRRFYVYYTDQQGFLQIDQFRAAAGAPNRADPSSRRSVIRVPHHQGNHKGGQLQVGADGMLYAGFGDGGGGGDPDENAQDLGEHSREDHPDRPARGRRLLGPGEQPLPEPLGRTPGGVLLRTSQPLPLLVRPQARQPDHRRRGAGRDRGDRLHPRGRDGKPPRGGYNFGWDVFEGRSPYESGRAPGAIYAPCSSTPTARASARSPAAT